jgi:hypothetical protein
MEQRDDLGAEISIHVDGATLAVIVACAVTVAGVGPIILLVFGLLKHNVGVVAMISAFQPFALMALARGGRPLPIELLVRGGVVVASSLLGLVICAWILDALVNHIHIVSAAAIALLPATAMMTLVPLALLGLREDLTALKLVGACAALWAICVGLAASISIMP